MIKTENVPDLFHLETVFKHESSLFPLFAGYTSFILGFGRRNRKLPFTKYF